MHRTLALLLLFSSVSAAQFLKFGFKAGVPIGDAYTDVHNVSNNPLSITSTSRYVYGPTLEIGLPLKFTFEADALYRHSDFEYNSDIVGIRSYFKDRVHHLEVPLLLKHALLPGPISPYVAAGVSYRHLFLNSRDGLTVHPDSAGATVGAGIRLKAGPVSISPEIRYTHWGSTGIQLPTFQSVRDQGDFLIGFTF